MHDVQSCGPHATRALTGAKRSRARRVVGRGLSPWLVVVSERVDKQREIAEFERIEAERELARAESTDDPQLHLRLADAFLIQARVHETLAAAYDREDDALP